MKLLRILCLFLFVIASACATDKTLKEGKVVYSIDYPNHKDNFFLYSILPKQMELVFKNGKMKSSIEKANLSNNLYIDCNKRQMSAYFSYADEAVYVNLKQADIQQMVKDQKAYAIKLTNEKDTIAGYDVKKAIAISKTDPTDKIDLWYTDQIKVKNSNWYNPFKAVPGFLLAYSIDRYGIRMEFKAEKIDGSVVDEKDFSSPNKGINIPYADYNRKLADLFKSFE